MSQPVIAILRTACGCEQVKLLPSYQPRVHVFIAGPYRGFFDEDSSTLPPFIRRVFEHRGDMDARNGRPFVYEEVVE